MSRFLSVCQYLALVSFFTGCVGFEGFIKKTGPKYEAEVRGWERVIQERGGDGMWLVNRGYRAGDNIVAIATCSALSHVGVLDAKNGVVIESLWNGNVTNCLANFVDMSHRVVLVQPEGWSPEKGREALAKARGELGKKYDFAGLIGLPGTNRWYCSELASWCWGREANRLGPCFVIHPRRLPKMGTVLFDSGPRDGLPDEPAQP